jgi:hypothetical protein
MLGDNIALYSMIRVSAQVDLIQSKSYLSLIQRLLHFHLGWISWWLVGNFTKYFWNKADLLFLYFSTWGLRIGAIVKQEVMTFCNILYLNKMKWKPFTRFLNFHFTGAKFQLPERAQSWYQNYFITFSVLV